MKSYLLFCALLFIDKSCFAVRLTKYNIPSHAINGEDLVLECDYDLEGDHLYSVKWYRNGQEFYRHIPTDNPQTVVFSQPGLVLNELRSTSTRLVVRNISLVSSGKYRCEVSGEAPLFQTATHSNVLTVIDPPDMGPVISGTQPLYTIGDTLYANCTSFKSFPTPTIHWYINGQAASHRLLKTFEPFTSKEGLITSTLGLRYKIDKNLSDRRGNIKIKCTATIDPIYWKSNEESIQLVPEKSYMNFWGSAAVPYSSNSLQLTSSFFTCIFCLTEHFKLL